MHSIAVAVCVLGFGPAPTAIHAQAKEAETLDAATRVLREIMAVPLKGIPASLLADAQGLVVIPGMLNGGFIVRIEHGRGVAIVRDKNGAWQSPYFVTLTGGGIGFQAGLQSTDLILVFRSRSSVDGLLKGKFTVGADASVAAGPIGRMVSAGTDAKLQSEIYSYSRSRGLFAGIALDGAALQLDNRATTDFYHRPGQAFPQSALDFMAQVAAYSNPHAVPADSSSADGLVKQLVEASARLNAAIDPQWQQYLALPPSITDANSVAPMLARFQTVAADPRYRTLTERHEFQETLALLSRFIAASSAKSANVLQLPPPPKP
jgi:lipid-binding SYLF domain-containing protein